MALKQLFIFLALEIGGVLTIVTGNPATVAEYFFGGFLMLCGVIVVLVPSKEWN